MKIQFSRASEKIRGHFFSRFFEIETLVNDWPVLHAKNLGRKTPQVSYCQGQSTLIYQTGAECTWWQWPSFKCGAGKTEGSENIMAAAGKTSRRSIIAASDPNNYKYLWIWFLPSRSWICFISRYCISCVY